MDFTLAPSRNELLHTTITETFRYGRHHAKCCISLQRDDGSI